MAATQELIQEVATLLTENDKADVFEAFVSFYSNDFGDDNKNQYAQVALIRLQDLVIMSADAKAKLGF